MNHLLTTDQHRSEMVPGGPGLLPTPGNELIGNSTSRSSKHFKKFVYYPCPLSHFACLVSDSLVSDFQSNFNMNVGAAALQTFGFMCLP